MEAVPCVPVGRAWQRRSEDGATEARDVESPRASSVNIPWYVHHFAS